MRDIYIPYAGEPLSMLHRTLDTLSNAGVVPVVIDNSHAQGLKEDAKYVLRTPPAPLTLWQTMWMLCQEPAPFLWTQCDAVICPGAVARLIAAVNARTAPWGIVFTHYDILSAVNGPELRARGVLPDLNLPHYYGDIDWYRRMRLAGLETAEAGGDDVWHEPGGGAHWRSNPDRDLARQCMDAGRYYREKWGGDIGHERYARPWNAKEPVIS